MSLLGFEQEMTENPQVRLRSVATLFIECATIHEEFGHLPSDSTKSCCKSCHEQPQDSGLISIRPRKENYPGDTNTDWDIRVEAIVCCALYDFVRALDRQWWIGKGKDVGDNDNDQRGYIYSSSTHKNTDKPRTYEKKNSIASKAAGQIKIKRKLQEDQEREEAGGLSGFLSRRG